MPEKSHGWRSLLGYSSWGCTELDVTERLHVARSKNGGGSIRVTSLQPLHVRHRTPRLGVCRVLTPVISSSSLDPDQLVSPTLCVRVCVHLSSVHPPPIHPFILRPSSIHPSSIDPSIRHPSIHTFSFDPSSIHHPSILYPPSTHPPIHSSIITHPPSIHPSIHSSMFPFFSPFLLPSLPPSH